MTMRRKRTALITLFLLIGLLAIPVVLTWRAVRQERLNHDLIAAVDRNDTSGVRRLLKQGADPDAQDLFDDTRPAWKRLWDRFRGVPHPQESALERAVCWFPMMSSVATYEAELDSNTDIVKSLADAGADINRRFSQPDHIFHFHIHTGLPPGPPLDPRLTTPLIWAAGLGNCRTVEALLTYKVDVNATDWRGTTALKAAVDAAQADMVKALLQRGANVHARNANGQTILFNAVQPTEAKVENVRATVACLLRYGASVQGKDRFGNTVLSEARSFWHVKRLIQMLQNAGAK